MVVLHSSLKDRGNGLWSVQDSAEVDCGSYKGWQGRGASWKYSGFFAKRLIGRVIVSLEKQFFLSHSSILLCLKLSRCAFLPGQTRVCGNYMTDNSSDTLGRHLNTELTICVRCIEVKMNPLACFHCGVERQMAQSWHYCMWRQYWTGFSYGLYQNY